MADIETKRIITIDAGQSLQTLRQLRSAIEANRQELAQLDKTSEAYDRELVKGKQLQQDYNATMRLAVKESKAVAGSYDALTVQLAKLKQQWKATGDEAERARLTKEVNKVKAQLDQMDHSIGNWQRNVGNYWGSFKDGLAKVAVAFAAVKVAFDAFKKAMDSTQSTGDALRNSIDAIRGSYDALMSAVVSGDWSAFSGGFWGVYDAAVAAAEAIDQLKNTQLAFDYLSTANVTKFNEQYNIWKDKSSTEAQKQAAYAQMKEIIDAQYKYAEGYNNQALDAYRALVVKEAGEANITLARVTTEQFQKAMLIDVSADPEKARAENERQYQQYLHRLHEYGKNNIVAQDNLKKQYADVIAIHAMLQLMKDDELKGLADILRGMEAARQSAQQLERRLLRGNGSSTGTQNTGSAASGTKAKKVDYGLATGEDEMDFYEEVELNSDVQKKLNELSEEGTDYRTAQRKEELRQQVEIGEMQRRAMEAQIEAEKKSRQEQIATAKAAATAMASIIGSVASAYQAYITQRLESGKISQEEAEREFENVKMVQYAQTWINALAGSVAVWAGEGTNLSKAAQSAAVLTQGIAATMQIANTTLGATSAAARSLTGAMVAAPVVVNMPSQVRTVTSASDEVALNERNQAQRVVLVYSDLQAFGKKVQVSQQESQF